jgi:hypothetical protein
VRDELGTVVQIVGFGCVIAAAFLIAVPLGLVALGGFLIPAGHALDGTTVKLPAWWRRRRADRLRRVA